MLCARKIIFGQGVKKDKCDCFSNDVVYFSVVLSIRFLFLKILGEENVLEEAVSRLPCLPTSRKPNLRLKEKGLRPI